MNHFRRLAMHQLRRTNHTPAKRLPDRLMTQTNTKQRHLSRKARDHFQRNPRRVRRTWSRRDHDPLGTQLGFDVLHRDAIVSMHFHCLTQLAEILHEVVSERIVVVDNQQHQGMTLKSCTILSRLLRAAHCIAVIPSLSRINASAPRLNNNCTALSFPLTAAHINGVPPTLFFAFGSAPLSSNMRMISTLPVCAAPCSAVSPSPSCIFTSAPRAKSFSTRSLLSRHT